MAGIHLNTLYTVPRDDKERAGLTDEERAHLDRLARAGAEISGYAAMQSTRPQTLAYALADSPAGQLAWIAEKFHDWADLTSNAIDRDRMLTAGSSACIYYESAKSGRAADTDPGPGRSSGVPTGIAAFTNELARPIRSIADRMHNVVH